MAIQHSKLGFISPEFTPASNLDAIREALFRKGVVFISGCDDEAVAELSKQLGRVAQAHSDVDNGTTVTTTKGVEGHEYDREELFFHTSGNSYEVPPRLLINALDIQSPTSGETLLADGHQIAEFLRTHEPALYDLFTSPKYSGPLYDTHTGVIRLSLDDSTKLSPGLAERLPELKKIISDHAFAFTLAPGQGYIIDNWRFLEGPSNLPRERKAHRVLTFPHVRPLLIDIDGTLCRAGKTSLKAWFRCINKVLNRSEGDSNYITFENTMIPIDGKTHLSFLHAILLRHGIPESEIPSLTQEFFALQPKILKETFEEPGADPCYICTGVPEMLVWFGELKKRAATVDIQIGLLTGNSQVNALTKLRASTLDTSLFDLDISAFGDVQAKRVNLVHDAIRKLEVKYGIEGIVAPKNVTLVGDTPLDVECAKLAGCKILAVTTGVYKAEQLREVHLDGGVFVPDLVAAKMEDAKSWFEEVIAL
ncbi:hypothetical protein BDN72DRAFT_962673 [Pluteus cervinus]|uniref:Uncharacterized protein n=1 Tax=Pluteus cervinus TaxID=181527 RepID=A0ACD3AI01_9AGAR|nr:hypothetical protein BDN72DRAFT_962673 [Pluteus cervinus]